MPRDQKQTATKKLRNTTLSHSHTAGRTFSHILWNKLGHHKIKEWVFLAAGLLTFLVAYLLLLNLVIWAHAPAGLLP